MSSPVDFWQHGHRMDLGYGWKCWDEQCGSKVFEAVTDANSPTTPTKKNGSFQKKQLPDVSCLDLSLVHHWPEAALSGRSPARVHRWTGGVRLGPLPGSCSSLAPGHTLLPAHRSQAAEMESSLRSHFPIKYHWQSMPQFHSLSANEFNTLKCTGGRLIPCRHGILGRLMVSSCMLIGGCRICFLMGTPCCTLDRRSFGLRMIEMQLTLSASCVFPLPLHASLPRTYNWLFSLMSTNYLSLRPPAAMTDG